MLSSKQSLILCAFIVVGFSVSGALGILDNYVVITVLLLAFIAVIVNLFLHKDNDDKDEEVSNKIE